MGAKIGLWTLLLAVILSSVLTSCSSARTSNHADPDSPQSRAELPSVDPAPSASQEEPLPSSCDNKLVEQLVPRVLKAINELDGVQLAKYFGQDLEWYSAGKAGDHRFVKAVTPRQLMDYLERRHQQHEKTELLELTVNSWSSTTVTWNMKLRISADDLEINPMHVSAKAQASCQTKRVTRWSVGFQDADTPSPALGHVPVPKEQRDWLASASTPEQAARLFALWSNESCDCDQVTVELVSGNATTGVVRIRMTGLKDDSLKNVEYLVVVELEEGDWKVTSATHLFECRRALSAGGMCS